MSHFVSKSEERRASFQQKLKSAVSKIPTCVHFSTPFNMPYRSNQVPCGKQIKSGFLCEDHKKQEESKRPHPLVRPVDQDPYIVQGILNTEADAIANGKVTSVRFGALEPVYLRYWSEK